MSCFLPNAYVNIQTVHIIKGQVYFFAKSLGKLRNIVAEIFVILDYRKCFSVFNISKREEENETLGHLKPEIIRGNYRYKYKEITKSWLENLWGGGGGAV